MKNIGIIKKLMACSLIFLTVACSEQNREIHVSLDGEFINSMFEGVSASSLGNGSVASIESVARSGQAFTWGSTSDLMGAPESIMSLDEEAQSLVLNESYNYFDMESVDVLFVDCSQCDAAGARYSLMIKYTLAGTTKTVIYESDNASFSEEEFELPMGNGFTLVSFDLDDEFDSELAADIQLRVLNSEGELIGKFSRLTSIKK